MCYRTELNEALEREKNFILTDKARYLEFLTKSIQDRVLECGVDLTSEEDCRLVTITAQHSVRDGLILHGLYRSIAEQT